MEYIENERLRTFFEFLKKKKIVRNQQDFAERIGTDKSTLSLVLNGKSKIPNTLFVKVERAFPEMNAEWLERGDGEMLREETNGPKNGKMKELPLIPFGAVVGFPTSDNAGIALKDCPLYSVPDFVALGADYLVRVIGDSMIPRYNQGDLLACRMLTDRTWLQWGKVYVMDTDQGVLVKRLFPCEKSDYVICRSENSDNYPDFELPKASIRSMSIVVGMIGIE